MTIIITCNLL